MTLDAEPVRCPHPAEWLSWAKDRPVYCGRCRRNLTEAEGEAALTDGREEGS
jgi:hypothetical protein